MGDRANVVIKSGGEQVCLYTHWNGSELPETVKKALIRGISRRDDFQYLTRIIFCEMVSGSIMETTGFGITQTIGDGGNRVLTVNCDDGTISNNSCAPMSFSDYCKIETADWSD